VKVVTILDTSVSSDNLGDEIIMQSVRRILRELMPDVYFYTVLTHDYISKKARDIINKSDFCVIGGTNCLSSHMLRGSNWKIAPYDIPYIKNVVLLGAGWQDYHPKTSAYTKLVYSSVLSKDHIHSTRDQYSTSKALSAGIGAINTSCPTLWGLDGVSNNINIRKSRCAVVSVTHYRPDPQLDRDILELVRDSYDKVYFWGQQQEDFEYLKSIGDFDFEIIPPNVEAYENILSSEDVDVIGSRLHGGIKALQCGRRALVIVVDNRAAEIGRDTNLAICQRGDLDRIRAWISAEEPVSIRLPTEKIASWRLQFAQ
jgi:polysaccharide pyruvyl transferase WcaK-like protein